MIDPLPHFRAVVKVGSDRYKVACPHPDHADEHPSATLNHHGGRWRWHCWSCGEDGDLVDVLRWAGMSLQGALAATGRALARVPRAEVLEAMRAPRFLPDGSLDVLVCDACLLEAVVVRNAAHLAELVDGPWTYDKNVAVGPRCAERGADWFRVGLPGDWRFIEPDEVRRQIQVTP